MYTKGDRVKTPGGMATVQYEIFSSFEKDRIACVSVKLDTSGTGSNSIYPISKVEKVIEFPFPTCDTVCCKNEPIYVLAHYDEDIYERTYVGACHECVDWYLRNGYIKMTIDDYEQEIK